MDDLLRAVLRSVAARHGTPSYVYFLNGVLQRIRNVRSAFGGRFDISFAVKSNPNVQLLRRIAGEVETLDVSSIGEVDRGLMCGCEARRMTFSGPAKRVAELRRAVELGCGEIVCESAWEIEKLDEISREFGRKTNFLIRINPSRTPRHFGVNMAGKPSQFGIDEEDLPPVLDTIGQQEGLSFEGFHIYSGTNCIQESAIAENFGIFIELFTRFSDAHGLQPRKLIFGSGFGIPYHDGQNQLDLAELAAAINPMIDEMRNHPRLSDARCVLEMGRYLVGPEGYFLTTVINEKRSRGTEIRMCDAGFNTHLAACGMLGTVIRRPWQISKLNASGAEKEQPYLLCGPLCTTIDILASNIELPELRRGDVLAIGSSGAYGVTSSPVRFISHPEPREILVAGSQTAPEIIDITECGASLPNRKDVQTDGRV